jgi:cystathionine beta-lyase/cystathionine gamma-synthase
MGASGTSICGLLIAKKNILSTVGSDDMRADFATWTKFWPFRDNGPNINPMAAILILNDLRTLRMKVAQMSRTTMKVAQFLETHPKVDKVNYPGLESFPEKDLAEKYMKLVDSDEPLFGHMLSIEVKEDNPNDSKNSRKFYDNLDMIWRATDLGRVKTVATLNAISTHQQQGEEGRKLADIKPSTCRISCGVEDPEDIISDLRRALDSI